MKKVFVAYPYSLTGYREHVAAAGQGIVELSYADDTLTAKHLLEKITDLMRSADLCLFDLTGWNVNVALELGVAIGLNLNYRVLLGPTKAGDVFSDMRGWDQLRYQHHDELRDKLHALFTHADTFNRPVMRLSDREIAVQPHLHIDLHGGMSGPSGSYLEGFVRNVGEGIAREPTLRLPGLGDMRLAGLLKPQETVSLNIRYDDKTCYTKQLDDLMASTEFEDRLGNLYRQEGPVTQGTTPGGTVLTYSINAFGIPYKAASRKIPTGTTVVTFTTPDAANTVRSRQRTLTNQGITRLGIGLHANALTDTHYGSQCTPREIVSSTDAFDEADDLRLEKVIRQLPSCNSFTVAPVSEGLIASDSQFDAKSFGSATNGIHIKTGGGIVLRFAAVGGHQFYDLFRTLGSAYALARYMRQTYSTFPISSVTFAFNIIGKQFPNVLPTSYQGSFEMDVTSDTFPDCARDAVVACLREGSEPRVSRTQVDNDLREFWRREFSGMFD